MKGGFGDRGYGRGEHGCSFERHEQGGRGFGRGQLGREDDKGFRIFGAEMGKGALAFKGGMEQKGQGSQSG